MNLSDPPIVFSREWTGCIDWPK